MSTQLGDNPGEEEDHRETVNKYGALIRGLDTESPVEITSASYICTRLNGLPKLEDDFEFDRGDGISSDALLYSLTFLLPEAKSKDYSDFEEYIEKGEEMSEYDDISELALYLYHKENEDREETRAWKRVKSELEDRSEEFEAEIEELKGEIGRA